MPTSCHESVGPQASTQVTRASVDLTFPLDWSRLRPFVILSKRRVRARPAPDSDPVRRHGPERGSTGEGGRPRSFLSGPPISLTRNAGAVRAVAGSPAWPPSLLEA